MIEFLKYPLVDLHSDGKLKNKIVNKDMLVVAHNVSTEEIGECFYALVHSAIDPNYSILFLQRSQNEPFAFT